MSDEENVISFCPKCNKDLPSTAKFCSSCGYNLHGPEKVRCPICKKVVQADEKFCSNCGNPLDLPITSWGKIVSGQKEEVWAVLLGLFVPGLGIIYAGRVGLGILIWILSLLLAIVLVGIIIWIYGIVKGYNMCKENNLIWVKYLKSC